MQLYFLVTPKPESENDIDVGFYLHTSKDQNINNTNCRVFANNLTSLSICSFNPNLKIKLIVHGYYHNGHRQWLKDMTAAFLQKEDYNVFRVDWGKGSFPGFDQAFSNMKVVGMVIAELINKLISVFSINSSNVHCIGHSMGAYICGFAGQRIYKLGQITALDLGPREVLGPLEILGWSNNMKLDASDADFVDAIHTDTKETSVFPALGESKRLGHIDIYVNGGYGMPGCNLTLEGFVNPNNNYEEIFLDLPINEIFCSHFRSIYYYIESIKNPSCQWVAYECSSYELFQKGECATCGDDNSKCGFLGPRANEYAGKSRKNVPLYIDTAAQSPYCVRHYVVSISIDLSTQSNSPPDGVITFEIIGENGRFTDQFKTKDSDDKGIVKSLFVSHVDVGQIKSVNLTWKITNKLVLRVNSIKVSPLTYYPESERKMQEVIACLPSDGPPTLINDGQTKNFPVMANC